MFLLLLIVNSLTGRRDFLLLFLKKKLQFFWGRYLFLLFVLFATFHNTNQGKETNQPRINPLLLHTTHKSKWHPPPVQLVQSPWLPNYIRLPHVCSPSHPSPDQAVPVVLKNPTDPPGGLRGCSRTVVPPLPTCWKAGLGAVSRWLVT